jgi:hypothetical protein
MMEAGGGLFSADAVFDDIDYFSDVDDSTSFDAEDNHWQYLCRV